MTTTNRIAAIQLAVTILAILALALTGQTLDTATTLLIVQGALSALGFRQAADSSLCCLKKRSIGTCPGILILPDSTTSGH